jgi:hypothetical protein
MQTDERTDMTKHIAAFHNFVGVLKNVQFTLLYKRALYGLMT